MQKTKLIALLKHLNSRELSRFLDYVNSPFYNKHKESQKLCLYISKYIGDPQKQHKLDKARIIKYLYPRQQSLQTNLHGLVSKLLTLLHDYLVIVSHEDNKNTHLIKVLAELRKRQQFKDYKAVLRKIDKNNKTTFEHIEEQYWQKFSYHKELDINFLTKGGRTYDTNLQLKSDFLDLFFITKKLKIACDMVSRNKVIGSDYNCKLIEDLLGHLQKSNNTAYSDEPSIKVYTAILQMLVNWKKDNYYPVVKDLLQQYQAIFSKSELQGIYDYALNYCIWKHNQDTANNHYLSEMLSIYKFVVKEKIIYVDGFLPPWEYKTIVTTSITLGELDWVYHFIEEYKMQLPPLIRESAYSYNLAFLLYSQQDYKGALQALYNVIFTNWTYYIGAKMIQIRSYYELNEAEALYSLVDAFRNYLNRNEKITEAHKRVYLNFINMSKRAFRLKNKKAFVSKTKYQKEVEKLQQNYQKTSPIAAKVWLNKIIEELAV